MAALKEHVKLFIVQHLACFDTPSEVAAAVEEEFGIEIDRSHVGTYDPTTHKGRQLGEKLKAFFYESREAFMKDFNSIPLANKSVRVRELTKMYKKALIARNAILAKDLLEQIAKETGGAYTNKIKLTGGDKGDEPVKVESQTTSRLMILREKKVKKAEDVAG